MQKRRRRLDCPVPCREGCSGDPGRRLDDALGSGGWLGVRSGSSLDSMEVGLRTIHLDDPLWTAFEMRLRAGLRSASVARCWCVRIDLSSASENPTVF